MAKANSSHDISFIDPTDSGEVGFMLATDKNGYKAYHLYDDPAFPNQFFTGQPDYGYLPPEKEVAIIQNSFDGGFGLEFADSSDNKRYYYSIGVDNRFKNNSILGPKATAIALPTTYTKAPPSVTNGDFETGGVGNPPTSWTVSAGTAVIGTANAANPHGGTYAVTITPAGADVIIYQDLTWNDNLKGTPVRAEVWFQCAGAAGTTLGKLTIDDGVGTTSASQSSFSANTWYKTTVTRTLDANATQLRITVTADYVGSNVACFADDCVVYVSHVDQPIASAEMADELYFAMGSCIFKLNATGDGFTYVGTVYYPITGLAVQQVSLAVDASYLFICTGSDQAYWYMQSSAETFTESNAADPYAEYILNVNDVMYKVNLPNDVTKSTNPRNGGVAWSTVSDIGSYENEITAVAVDVDIPYFGKEDTVFYLDTTDADYPLIADMQSLRASTNCKNMMVWHKKLYVPCGTQGLVEYSDGVVTWRSPAKFCTNLNYFTGSVQALAADEEYLYAVVDNGTKVEILAGQERVVDGATVWAWHPIQELTLAGCQYAVVSNVYKKRLWIASTSASDSVYWLPVTTRYGDIANDSDYTYQTGGYDITPWYHLNLRADSKAYLSMTVTAEGCNSTNYVNVYYQTYYTALAGTWTLLGKFDTSPLETISLIASAPTGTMIRFKREIVTASTSTTPKITGMDCRGIWRPTKRKMIQCSLLIKDHPTLRNGAVGDEIEASLATAVEAANAATSPVTLYDIDGSEHKVSFLNASKQNVKLVKDRNPEYEYFVTMQVLS